MSVAFGAPVARTPNLLRYEVTGTGALQSSTRAEVLADAAAGPLADFLRTVPAGGAAGQWGQIGSADSGRVSLNAYTIGLGASTSAPAAQFLAAPDTLDARAPAGLLFIIEIEFRNSLVR